MLFLAAISFLDDLRPLPARVRFAAHCSAAAIFLYFTAPWSDPLLHSENTAWQALLWMSLFLWLVGYTNAFNFMDGINGIAGGQGVITGFGTALLPFAVTGSISRPLQLCAAIVAGSCLGFLPHNFPRARMFMGDVGSAPLGFVLAALAVAEGAAFGWSVFVALLLLHLNYVLDTSLTLLRRLFRGDRVYEAHKEHFYQRLVRAGKSHTFTTACEMALQLVTLALAFCFLTAHDSWIRIATVLTVVAIWSGFFLYAETLFRRSQTAPAEARIFPGFTPIR